jgi:hypothetical protein
VEVNKRKKDWDICKNSENTSNSVIGASRGTQIRIYVEEGFQNRDDVGVGKELDFGGE